MSTVQLSPSVLRADTDRMPLRAPNYKPGAVLGVFWTIAGFALVIAIVAQEPGFRILMGSLALLTGVSAPVVVRWTESISAGRVQIDTSQAALRFVAPLGTLTLFPVLAIVGVVPSLVVLGFSLAGLPTSTSVGLVRWGPYVLGLLGLAWLVQQLVSLGTAPGLTLTAEGLAGVRGTARVRLTWDELAGASVAADGTAKLVLTRVGGSPIVIEPRWTGSDPNQVAAIIEHFRRNPADRALLADPRAAIGRVEERASS